MKAFFSLTPRLIDFLTHVDVSDPELRSAVSNALKEKRISIPTLLKLPKDRPLYDMLQGSQLFVPVAPRPKRRASFEEKLTELRHAAERRAYAAMVGEKSETFDARGMKSLNSQLSLGLNMMISAVTVFVACYWSMSQGADDRSHVPWIVGLGGAIGILMVETVLLIVRTTVADKKEESDSKQRHKRHNRGVIGTYALSEDAIQEILKKGDASDRVTTKQHLKE